MSIVNLKDVKVYATFKSGFRVVEESVGKNGETYKQRWTVWADAEASGRIREGDVVSLSGFLSAKVNEWTDKDGQLKHSVELSVNSPRMGGEASGRGAVGVSAPVRGVSGTGAGSGWPTAQAGAQSDAWNTPTDDQDGTPF